MEAKTIGKFITALRKANGMTQKDLAEKLNVSDKTVSRWEREEGAPDLSMIPIIAEIFDVTCDELLRGERKSPAERETEKENNTFDAEEVSAKGEKQLKRLLKATFSKYQSHTYISMGLSIIGILVALICNFAFLKAVLGFFLGAVFFAAAVICQAIVTNKAMLSVEDACLEPSALSEFKRNVIRLAQKSVGLTVGCLGFIFPLAFLDAYVGLQADSLLVFGLIGAAVFLVIYVVILYFYNDSLLRKQEYVLPEKEAVIYHHNHALQKRCAAWLVLLVLITFGAHKLFTDPYGPFPPVVGTTFEDYESFIAYMEQDIPYSRRYNDNGTYIVEQIVPSDDLSGEVWIDEYGNVISEEEARRRTLKDSKGNVVCEYIDRNEYVSSISYSVKEGTVLPITVVTFDDLDTINAKLAIRHVIFAVVYAVEVLAVVLIYTKKRMK